MNIISLREHDYFTVLIKTWEGLLFVFWTWDQLSRIWLPPPPSRVSFQSKSTIFNVRKNPLSVLTGTKWTGDKPWATNGTSVRRGGGGCLDYGLIMVSRRGIPLGFPRWSRPGSVSPKSVRFLFICKSTASDFLSGQGREEPLAHSKMFCTVKKSIWN